MKIRIICFCLFFFFYSLHQAQKTEDGKNKTFQIFLQKAESTKFKDWPRTLETLKEAEKSIKDEIVLADFYLEAAKICNSTNHYDDSLEYLNKSFKIYSGKSEEKIVEIEGQYAYIFSQLNDTPKAINYFRKILKFYESKNRKKDQLKVLNNLGNAYSVIDKPDSSVYYFNRALSILKTEDSPMVNVFVLSNLGKTYYIQGKTEMAEKCMLDAENLMNEKKVSEENAQFTVYYNLSKFYLQEKNGPQALKYAEKLRSKVDDSAITFQNLNYLETIYKALLLNRNFEKASYYFQKYDSVRRTMNVEEMAVNAERSKLQHSYEIQQKNNEIRESKKKVNFYLGGLILLLISAISFTFFLNNRNKIEKLKLESQLRIAREKELETENHIQEKMLTFKSMEQSRIEEILKSILDKIDVLKSKLKEQENVEIISNIIKEVKINIKNDPWEEFENHFVKVHESFYKNLDEKFPDLTVYDKRLAAMIKLKLSTKEISNLLNLTPKTVENSRTRLRKKLNLTNTKTDIYEFLNTI